ncbi:transcription termination/antitermination NusG family protein [Telmatospirillum sp.]|uniref:transcription termination/antitermination NusG family protein n=1 Tax=Telmatospirillum sp. TaxID=2079197 RepID=UPI002845A53D|nr:transcription termination/antitermination NusG family protein [Telmatospirillum sp.]MDR3435447.1 transcription termination/antitermination NusG family protein [Telmatospirillum sp.]
MSGSGEHRDEDKLHVVPTVDLPARALPDRGEGALASASSDVLPDQSRRRWYVFRCLARQEGLAEANLAFQTFVCFLPKVLVTKRHARRFVTTREWLFPRYGFIALDLGKDRWHSVNGTFGVERLVMGKQGPQPVPNGIVESLQTYVDERGLIDFDQGLKPGAVVRVKRGPFAGTLGVLQSLDGKGRAELLLDLMNGQVRAKTAREWIEAVA